MTDFLIKEKKNLIGLIELQMNWIDPKLTNFEWK